MRCSGPYAQPSFQPVTEKVFPADPMEMVRSHIPGKEATRTILLSSKTMCSYTSSEIISTSWAMHKLQISVISGREKNLPQRVIWVVVDYCFSFWSKHFFKLFRIQLPI